MISFDEFKRWFNRDFWRAFKKAGLLVVVPQSASQKRDVVRETYESIVNASYFPSLPVTEIHLNKRHGVSRIVPVFCIRDYIVYYFCIKELEDVLCVDRAQNTFGGWSLGGKMRSLEETDITNDQGNYSPKYSFNPLAYTKVWGEFNALLYSQLDSHSFDYVLQFDLANFYDSIRLDKLEKAIRESSNPSKSWVITLLFFFLSNWNRKNTALQQQTVGIPQDPLQDCSRVLANFYLQQYDKFASDLCSGVDSVYFRYADDQMILMKSEVYTESLMLLLSKKLNQYGLSINQLKVKIWKSKELQQYRSRRIHSIFKQSPDRDDPALVRKFVDEYLKLSVAELRDLWKGGSTMLKRLLRANLKNLSRKQYEIVLVRMTEESFLKYLDAEEIEIVWKLNLARKNPINIEKRLLGMSDVLVHNSFHYELYQFAIKLNRKSLIKSVEARITDINLMIDTRNLA